VAKKTTVDVQVGPNVARHVRKHRKPIGAVVLIGFLILDSAKLHLLHHLLGQDSAAAAAILVVIAAVWGLVRWLG
jgi:hypothetical protein